MCNRRPLFICSRDIISSHRRGLSAKLTVVAVRVVAAGLQEPEGVMVVFFRDRGDCELLGILGELDVVTMETGKLTDDPKRYF